MKRNVAKAVAEYKRRFGGDKDIFTLYDVGQIREMFGDEVDLVYNGLMAGFMVGYRAAQRAARKRGQGKA